MDIPYEAVVAARKQGLAEPVWQLRCPTDGCWIAGRLRINGSDYFATRPLKVSAGLEAKTGVTARPQGVAWPLAAAPPSVIVGCRHKIGTVSTYDGGFEPIGY